MDAFFELYSRLPRQGPGSDATTLKALRRLPPLPPQPCVLDLGCGSGRQTLVLARQLNSRIIAIDTHQPYLDELKRAAAAAGLTEWVETRCLSMGALDYAAESIDLIWCEGAVYFLGVSKALRLWRPLLRPGAFLAFTEATWLTADPAPEVAAFWAQAYPAMSSVAGNVKSAEAEGYQVLDTFPLPPEDWWREYYTPLQARMAALRERAAGWPELAEEIKSTEEEIRFYERYGESYGYVFYLLRKPQRDLIP